MLQGKIKLKSIDEQLDTLSKNLLIQRFMKENPGLSRTTYKRSLSLLKQFVKERENCNHCPGLSNCPNLVQGHYPTLKAYSNNLDIQMNPCDKLKTKLQQDKRKKLIQCHQIPIDVQQATFDDIEFDKDRDFAIGSAIDFCTAMAEKKQTKGLYIYGSFGVGKSYIAGAIANALAKIDIEVLFMHSSALASEMRESVSEKTVSPKIEALSKVPVLILDDIGSETLTPFIRDDVLSIVLQNRMINRLPTIYTSNLTLNELEDYLSTTIKNGYEKVDPLKGKRIMERIRPFVVPVAVKGRNRRYDKAH